MIKLSALVLIMCAACDPGPSSGAGGASSSSDGLPSIVMPCHRVTFETTCPADTPIGIECTNDKAPSRCTLHNLAPDYFCCP